MNICVSVHPMEWSGRDEGIIQELPFVSASQSLSYSRLRWLTRLSKSQRHFFNPSSPHCISTSSNINQVKANISASNNPGASVPKNQSSLPRRIDRAWNADVALSCSSEGVMCGRRVVDRISDTAAAWRLWRMGRRRMADEGRYNVLRSSALGSWRYSACN